MIFIMYKAIFSRLLSTIGEYQTIPPIQGVKEGPAPILLPLTTKANFLLGISTASNRE